jgi:iron complex transport system substrate-binding protein
VRAVSLVPSATETVIALGARDCLIGVSDDCSALSGASGLPVISRAVLAGLSRSPVEVDSAVRSERGAGRSLYELDIVQLRALSPDVIFAQDQCAVCAVPSSAVLAALGPGADACRVVSIDPHNLPQVFASFEQIAEALGLCGSGEELARQCRHQLDSLDALGARSSRPTVLVLDWPEPAFVAGNWVPEIVAAAGGSAVGCAPGEPSHPIDLGAFERNEHGLDAVVVAPCGLPIDEAADAARHLLTAWPALGAARWCALDGRAWFSRPGPGLLEGAAGLAAWLAGEGLPAEMGQEITPPLR